MFRASSRGGRDPLLPHSGNGRGGGGGLFGTARTTRKPALSKSFMATMAWALLSLSMIGGGWLYCSRRMESTWVLCDRGMCKIEEVKAGVRSILLIPRLNMVRGELVRVKNGEMVNPSKLGRSAQRKLGHTYSVVYLEPESEDDDDESYDSFEDDDDSYDSYDGDDASSEDDDAKNDAEMATMARLQQERERAFTSAGARTPPAGGPSGAKSAMPGSAAAERKKIAEAKRKEEQRAAWAKERAAEGLPPIREPDEPKRPKGRPAMAMDDRDQERFPGDAATMFDRNRRQINSMEAAQGMAEAHRERSQRAYEEASRAHQAKHRMDSQTRQIGNNLHDRAVNDILSPDDPDSKPSAGAARRTFERQKAQADLNVGAGDEGGGGGGSAEKKEGDKDQEPAKGGSRTISSVGGLEELDETDRRRLSSLAKEEQEEFDRSRSRNRYRTGTSTNGDHEDLQDGGADLEVVDDLARGGAAGARRKLSSVQRGRPRVEETKAEPAKPTKEELAKDAAKTREAHRQGHGHHQKRARKVAQPTDPEETSDGSVDGVPRSEMKHHHKAFHHKNYVPQADRHHVHRGFHHNPGEKKIDHGWRHQNRQWHNRQELKKLGTTYSLGRAVARKRKEDIDSYVSRRVAALDFTDSKKWRAGGLWLIVVGCISTAFCLVIGDFQPRPKTKKVS